MKNEGFSERKKRILNLIVETHIEGGEPVGSKSLLELPVGSEDKLSCSAATLRHEMAELEELGYLEHPHTSAGRVPTELGYRYYVDCLMEHYANTANEIRQIDGLLEEKMKELDQILLAASKLASSMTNYPGFAVKPPVSTLTIRRFNTIFLDEHCFVLVAVASNGTVINHTINDVTVTQEQVNLVDGALNRYLVNLAPADINVNVVMNMENAIDGNANLSNRVIRAVYEMLTAGNEGKMEFTGISHLLSYPEYSNTEELQNILGTLEEKKDILGLVSVGDTDDIRVVIGSECAVKEMNNSALIYKPILVGGKAVGAIGVLGPRRMDYAKVLETLQNLGGNIENLIEGEQHGSKSNE